MLSRYFKCLWQRVGKAPCSICPSLMRILSAGCFAELLWQQSFLLLYFQHAGEAKMLKRVCFKHIFALEPKFRVTVACPLSGTWFLLTCLPRILLVCRRDSSSEAEAIIYRKRKNLSKQKHQQLLHIKVKAQML